MSINDRGTKKLKDQIVRSNFHLMDMRILIKDKEPPNQWKLFMEILLLGIGVCHRITFTANTL